MIYRSGLLDYFPSCLPQIVLSNVCDSSHANKRHTSRLNTVRYHLYLCPILIRRAHQLESIGRQQNPIALYRKSGTEGKNPRLVLLHVSVR